MMLTGSKILMNVLREEKVKTIFGYPGAAVIDIYDEIARTEIQHVMVRHEQGAVHAADGYARASGQVGVCLVTSGPGATNTVTGIASAHADSIPMVILTGQVPTHLVGGDAFQEVDIVGITQSCTKHNYMVQSIADFAQILKEAFYLARSGRPGPVLIDIPKDIVRAQTSYVPPADARIASYNPTTHPNLKQLREVIKLIKGAKRPLIFAGGGVVLSGGARELTHFARAHRIPVTTSLMGLGAFPGSDPLFLGMIGMHGTWTANMSTSACDLMLAIGVRFDDRVTGKTEAFASQASIVHIDIDPTSIRKNISVQVPVVGDCRISLDVLNNMLESSNDPRPSLPPSAWLRQVAEWKRTHPLSYQQNERIKPQYVIEKVYQFTKGDAIITTDVGQHQMWTAQHYLFDQPNHFITSGGLGTMGFGLPAAIGAQIARPDKTVIGISGDGSIQMNIQEMATAVKYGLPVKIVILNNGYLGMVRQWQELFYEKQYSSTQMDHSPDFVKLAEAYGATGLRTTQIDDVEKTLETGLATPGPVIMDFQVDPEENVYPMVPSGAPITEMLST